MPIIGNDKNQVGAPVMHTPYQADAGWTVDVIDTGICGRWRRAIELTHKDTTSHGHQETEKGNPAQCIFDRIGVLRNFVVQGR